MIDKESMLFDRDEKGELISEERKLKDETIIKIIPMTRGEIKKYFSELKDNKDRDFDGELILKYCKEPKFTEEEIKFLKWNISNEIIGEIFRASGVIEKKKDSEIEVDLKKNLTPLMEDL